MLDRVECRCYAKLNLALAVSPRIGGEGPWANHHRIASWMHAIDLYDDLLVERAEGAAGSDVDRFVLEPAPGASGVIPGRELIDWARHEDLSIKALRGLERHVGRELAVRITLRKRIPAAGGLGGGSADAGKLLTALCDLYELELDERELMEVALGVGSDVCFFTDRGVGPDEPVRPGMVEFLGNHIKRLNRSSGEVVLIVPGIGCSTRAVYQAYHDRGQRLPAGSFQESEIRAAASAGRCENGLLMNELTESAFAVGAGLGELHDALEAALPGNVRRDRVHVTGSGSTLFVLKQPGDPGDLVDRLRDAAGDQPVGLIETRLV